MPLEIDRKELKQRARQAMSAVKPNFWVVTLVYLLMTAGVSLVAGFTTGALATFLSIAITLYGWVVDFSYRLWALWTSRRLDPDLGALMDGFTIPGRIVLMELGILIRTLGWTMLASFLVSMLTVPFASPVMVGIGVAVAVIAVQIITLRYRMAPYLLADHPELPGSIPVTLSVWLTRGMIGEIVKLYLSFAGWYILAYLLSAVGLAIGVLLSGGFTALIAMPVDQMLLQVWNVFGSPVSSALMALLPLPVTLFLTPYVEVTMAELYSALIARPDFHPEEKMPPV